MLKRNPFRAVAQMLLTFGASTMMAVGDPEESLKSAGRSLDKIEKHLAEWGHASISSFVLVPDNSTNGQFDLKHNVPLADYLSAIRSNVQGKAAFLQQKEFAGQLEARAANAVQGRNVQGPPAPLSPTSQAALQRQNEQEALLHQIRMEQYRRELARITNSTDGWQTNAIALPTNSSLTEPARNPTGPSNTVPETPKITNTLPSSPITNGFAPISGLLDGFPGAQISETALLKAGATAKETERVLNFMSHPLDVPGNKKVFFAIGQISVMPGWRTRRDYICEVSARFTYAGHTEFVQERVAQALAQHRKPKLPAQLPSVMYANGGLANELNLPEDNFSLVSAFPFTESQVLDVQNSFRSQVTFLMNLAASYLQAGYKIDAEILTRFVNRIEKDFATRTAFPTVVPGVDANTLTYRFDPEASAMIDPTKKKPEAGLQLLPTSIPVLVLAVAEKEGFEQWPQLAVQVETRWVPRIRHNWWRKILVDAPTKFRLPDTYFDPSRLLELTVEFDSAMDELFALNGAGKTEYEYYGQLRRRLVVLQHLGWGRTTFIDLPGREPLVTRLQPAVMNQNQPAPIEIFGRNLIESSPLVRIGGIPVSVDMANARAEKIAATFGPTIPLDPGSYDVEVETSRGKVIYPKGFKIEGPDASPICAGRPPIVATVVPERGFINDRTSFALTGSGFNANRDKVKQVIVGGRVAENLQVISDTLIQFDLPKWNDGGAASPYPDANHRADVFVVANCAAVLAANKVYFDIVAPPSPPGPAKSDFQKRAALMEKLKELGEESRFSGALRLEVGKPPLPSDDSDGSRSTVIIQNGENTNRSK